MEMIFSLGMNKDEEDVYLAGSKEYLGEKKFDESLVWDIVKFLRKIIDDYDGWIPLAEFYCWFNRAWGTGIIPPQKLVQICSKELNKASDGDFQYIPNFEVNE